MTDVLKTIRDKFNAFRAASPDKVGKQLRYPKPLQALLLEGKNAGHKIKDLAIASGLSEGGLNKMIERHATVDPTRRGPGRPRKDENLQASKASRNVLSKIKSAGKKTKTKQKTVQKTVKKGVKASQNLLPVASASKTAKRVKSKMLAKAKVKTSKKIKTKDKAAAKMVTSTPSSFAAPKKRGRPRKDSSPQITLTVFQGGKEVGLKISAKDLASAIINMV